MQIRLREVFFYTKLWEIWLVGVACPLEKHGGKQRESRRGRGNQHNKKRRGWGRSGKSSRSARAQRWQKGACVGPGAQMRSTSNKHGDKLLASVVRAVWINPSPGKKYPKTSSPCADELTITPMNEEMAELVGRERISRVVVVSVEQDNSAPPLEAVVSRTTDSMTKRTRSSTTWSLPSTCSPLRLRGGQREHDRGYRLQGPL
ncbi:hypothetical protein CEXT_746951 [Caerostris extrusa]|uniref:Uncharacterized protein n=1 Tax=Caerostris extrusa TaxID=172846 RepID=A0AAV4SQP4_CAEEX|nr:hypothetical protein CEXT_746951 [Caerostris extrusa]